MTAIDKDRSERVSLNGVARLSRTNVEVVGVLMYFTAIAFIFGFALILMVFQLGPGSHEKAGNDNAPGIESSL
jgi:hypothetical protein